MENKIKNILIPGITVLFCACAPGVYNMTKSEPVPGTTPALYVREKPENGLLSLRAIDKIAHPGSGEKYDQDSDATEIITYPYRGYGVFPGESGFCSSKECCVWLEPGEHTAAVAVFESFGLCNAIHNNFDPVYHGVMNVRFSAKPGKIYELKPDFEYAPGGGCEPKVSLSVVESTGIPPICLKEAKKR